MITKKQLEKLAETKLGPCKLLEYPTDSGWYVDLSPPDGRGTRNFLEAAAPTRSVARAGLNAMLFALPKRRRPSR